MRKVLFATTALVALGGVSAASADISVSGSASHNFVSGSGTGYSADSQSMSTTVDFGISGSTTLDNGMTVAGGIDLDEGAGDQPDDSGWTLSGDFGTLAFGGYANAAFGAMSVDVTADEGHGGFTSTTASRPCNWALARNRRRENDVNSHQAGCGCHGNVCELGDASACPRMSYLFIL
jgi:hypothetical protein